MPVYSAYYSMCTAVVLHVISWLNIVLPVMCCMSTLELGFICTHTVAKLSDRQHMWS